MIRHTVTVLPPKKKNFRICNLLVNSQITEYHLDTRFCKIPRSENMLLTVLIKDMDNMQSIVVDYPNIYLEAYLYEESTKNYTKKNLKFKKNGIIIKPKDEQVIKMKIALKNQDKVIDYCLIDIV